MTFHFDTKKVLKIVPNFDRDPEKRLSNTYTVIYKDGDTEVVNCKGPEDFQAVEATVKAGNRYRNK